MHTIGIEATIAVVTDCTSGSATTVGTDCTSGIAKIEGTASRCAKATSGTAVPTRGAVTGVAGNQGTRHPRHVDWSILLQCVDVVNQHLQRQRRPSHSQVVSPTALPAPAAAYTQVTLSDRLLYCNGMRQAHRMLASVTDDR